LPFADSTELPAKIPLRDGTQLDCSAFEGTFPLDYSGFLEITHNQRPYRVYAINPMWWGDLAHAVQQRAGLALDGLAPLSIVPINGGAVVVVPSLPDGTHPLVVSPPVQADPLLRASDALSACILLARTLKPLHEAGLLWLNFDPAGLLLAEEDVQLTSLDLMTYTTGARPASLRTLPHYAAPELCSLREERLSPATDVFHVAVYLWYRLAGVAPQGLPGAGLEAFDFKLPPLRIYNPTLPPSVEIVLARGLARDPAERFASLHDLAEALSEAVAKVRHRAFSKNTIRYDAGSATAVGKTHEIQGLPNQDSFYLRAVGPDSLLAIVADGVTHAQIGSGEQASRLAVEILSERLEPMLATKRTNEELNDLICASCEAATKAILEAALPNGPPPDPFDPADVMSTTLVMGILQGNELTIASLGDSRAYLLQGAMVEQMTVDGDVRCTQLAKGWPPEQIHQLGFDASALYSCLGIGDISEDGTLTPAKDRSQPQMIRWKLLPGDVVVLCTDGLVEEGVFLEPRELAHLLWGETDRPASELAQLLVDAAKERHRDATPLEPEGCGDDVTCVVLVVKE
jgi:serine/threonine protein phosphatase PrpC